MKCDNFARAESFLPNVLHHEDTYLLKLRFLSICKPSNFFFLLSQIFYLQFEPQNFHACKQIPIGDIYLDLILCFYFETIQLLLSYYISRGWKPLTIITKRSILDVAAVLDPPLHISVLPRFSIIWTL